MKIFGVIALFMLIALIDIPAIVIKSKHRARFIWIYAFILVSGFTISLLQVINKAPTSPAKVIESIIKGVIGEP